MNTVSKTRWELIDDLVRLAETCGYSWVAEFESCLDSMHGTVAEAEFKQLVFLLFGPERSRPPVCSCGTDTVGERI